MKRNRVVGWLVVGSVVVLGGFAFVAYKMDPAAHNERYDIAVWHLSRYAGPSVYVVSPLGDPRTRMEDTVNGYVLMGVFKTDHPDLAVNTKQSPTGEIRFAVYMDVESRVGGLVKGYSLDRFHFEPVK